MNVQSVGVIPISLFVYFDRKCRIAQNLKSACNLQSFTITLLLLQVRSGNANNELSKIVEWIPKVWQHLNKFLEAHSSSEVTVGPRLFLACPMDAAQAHVWFTDLYNFSIVPYLLEAVREGIQVSHVIDQPVVKFRSVFFRQPNIPLCDTEMC